MAEEIKQQMADYLAEHRYMALATVGADGKPVVHTVGYTSEGTTVYCATFKQSRKAHNIVQNPSVAFVVDEDYHDLESIKGIQMQGQANILVDPGETQRDAEKRPILKDLCYRPPIATTFCGIPVVGRFSREYTRQSGMRHVPLTAWGGS